MHFFMLHIVLYMPCGPVDSPWHQKMCISQTVTTMLEIESGQICLSSNPWLFEEGVFSSHLSRILTSTLSNALVTLKYFISISSSKQSEAEMKLSKY